MSSFSICLENDSTININGTAYSRDEAEQLLCNLARTLGCEVYRETTLGELQERDRLSRLLSLTPANTLGDFQKSSRPMSV